MAKVSVGVGARSEWFEALVKLDRKALDTLEVMIDDGLDDGPMRSTWRRLGAKWPLIAHGTELGIGDAAGLDEKYVTRVGAALGAISAHWYSEHLSFLDKRGVDLGHFAPIEFDDAGLEVLRENAAFVRAKTRRPLLLENPADILGFGAERGATALAREYRVALEVAEAGALLDLANIVLSARNDGYDAAELVAAVPGDRIVEVHLAGGHREGSLHVDSHAHDVDEEAWSLLESVVARAPGLRAIVIERDERLPSLDVMLGQVERARSIATRLRNQSD